MLAKHIDLLDFELRPKNEFFRFEGDYQLMNLSSRLGYCERMSNTNHAEMSDWRTVGSQSRSEMDKRKMIDTNVKLEE
jgi:hypothetical protein